MDNSRPELFIKSIWEFIARKTFVYYAKQCVHTKNINVVHSRAGFFIKLTWKFMGSKNLYLRKAMRTY